MDNTVSAATDVFSTVSTWWKHPFATNMTGGGWFAFFGLVVAISVAWGLILKDLRGEL